MAVARKSASDPALGKAPRDRRKQPTRNSPSNVFAPTVIPLSDPSKSKVQIPMMSQQATPLWLLRLCTFQRGSAAVTFLLVAATLFVYGWTVYSQQLWSQAYRNLENLQRQERQLTTTNEMLKNQMAMQAQKPGTSLVSPSPSAAIFLPATPTDKTTSPATTPNAVSAPIQTPISGY